MKILFLHRVWPIYGGGETVTICLANEMVKRGIDVYVSYFHDSEPNLSAIFIDPRIKTYRIDNVSFNIYSKDFFVNKKESAYVSALIVKKINELHIDIIHNQWWPVEFLKGVHDRTNAKIITCLHMDVDIRKVFNVDGVKQKILNIIYPLYRKIEREKNLIKADKYYRLSDKFVFLSPAFREKYRLFRGLKQDDSKLEYVYNPLVFSESISEEDREKKECTVLFVGRLLENHKQIIRILYAWKKIQDSHYNDGWNLVLVGEGPDKQQYQDYVKLQKLKHVSFEGYQQPLKYYRAASIFCMTSAYEGLPMTLVEALQNGVVPVVMNSFDSLHDIVVNGENGVIVPDGDIDAFANAMVKLMHDEVFRKRLSDNGIKLCLKFQVQEIVNKWEEIYKKIVR